MQAEWNVLKGLIATKKLQYQSVESDTRYTVTAVDSSYSMFCFIEKTTPRNANQIDFEDNFLAGSNKRIENNVKDIINNGGVQGSLTVGTSSVELRVGASRLSNRKMATLHNNSNNVLYWGFTSSVTIATGTPIARGQFVTWDIGPDAQIWIIAASAGNNARITEAS